MPIIDELLVALGYDYDDDGVTNFRQDIGETVTVVTKLIKATVAAATAMTGMVVASTLATDEQGKLADEIGVTVEELSALQFAGQRAGVASEGISSSLRGLSRRASEAARGVGRGTVAFGILGVTATDAAGR